MNDPKRAYGVNVVCAICNHPVWVERPPERRNKAIPEGLDLECGNCGVEYCAKHRKYEWNEVGYKHGKD